MAGTAKTSRFMLGSATLMIGQMSELYDMLPATHSVGLIKNFSLNADPTFADLTQGSKNTVVFSQLTGFPVKGTTEVYEYTAQNMAYALALDGHAVSADVTVAVGLSASIVSGDTVLAVTSVTGLAVGKYIMLIDTTKDDTVLVRKITDITSLNVTVDQAVNSAWSSTTTSIKQVNGIDVGSIADQPFLAAVATGKTADGNYMEVRMPKVRITKGFTLAFNSEQYQNMPFELTLLDLLPTDTFYADFKTKKAQLFTP